MITFTIKDICITMNSDKEKDRELCTYRPIKGFFLEVKWKEGSSPYIEKYFG
jgi:hypothetical protein